MRTMGRITHIRMSGSRSNSAIFVCPLRHKTCCVVRGRHVRCDPVPKLMRRCGGRPWSLVTLVLKATRIHCMFATCNMELKCFLAKVFKVSDNLNICCSYEYGDLECLVDQTGCKKTKNAQAGYKEATGDHDHSKGNWCFLVSYCS